MWVKENIYKPMHSLESCKTFLSPRFIFAALFFFLNFVSWFIFSMNFHFVTNMVSNTSSLKFFKEGKPKAIYFIKNKFSVSKILIIFYGCFLLFLTNTWRRLASKEIKNFVVNSVSLLC